MKILVLGAGVIGTSTAWYLNTGHGTLGWTMAASSGRALADIISGRKPDVDFAFTLSPALSQGRGRTS